MVDDLFDISARDDDQASVVLRVHVQPAAGRTAVVGRHGTALKVRVAAPPEAGRANDACCSLLAETFGVAASAVELTSGASSRMKRFRIDGVDLDAFRDRLEQAVNEGTTGRGPKAGRS